MVAVVVAPLLSLSLSPRFLILSLPLPSSSVQKTSSLGNISPVIPHCLEIASCLCCSIILAKDTDSAEGLNAFLLYLQLRTEFFSIIIVAGD